MSWEPIETMPKNGKLVLLAYSTGDGPFDWGLATGRHTGWAIQDSNGSPFAFFPTHWQEIAPPSTSGGEG